MFVPIPAGSIVSVAGPLIVFVDILIAEASAPVVNVEAVNIPDAFRVLISVWPNISISAFKSISSPNVEIPLTFRLVKSFGALAIAASIDAVVVESIPAIFFSSNEELTTSVTPIETESPARDPDAVIIPEMTMPLSKTGAPLPSLFLIVSTYNEDILVSF